MADVSRYDCYAHRRGGPTLSLFTLERDGSALDILLSGLHRLWPFVRPLSLDVQVGCVEREIDYPAHDLFPARTLWFAYDGSAAAQNPAHGEADGSDDNALEIIDAWHPIDVADRLADLSIDAIRSWITRAQAQPSPAPDTHDVEWTALWISATRARVFGADHLQTRTAGGRHVALFVEETPSIVDVPLEWRDGFAWVAGPTRAMRRQLVRAPFELHATNEGRVDLHVTPNWSFWTQAGSRGHTALVETGRAMLTDGWQVGHTGWAFSELT